MIDLSTLKSFLQMGGYAFYVWSAYGLTLSVILINFYRLNRLKKKACSALVAGTLLQKLNQKKDSI